MRFRSLKWMFVASASTVVTSASVRAGTLRVVEYNVNADTTDANGFNNASAATVQTVLQAIGQHKLAGNAQPIDVLALTELQGLSSGALSPTLTTIVNDLNAVYGAGTYAADQTAATTDSPTSTGNGPSGLIYNTKTIGSVTAKIVATASSANDPRSPMRYLIQPLAGSSASQFYLYVEHAKANASDAFAGVRANESVLVRQDADSLAAGAHVIYTGDFNLAGASSNTSTGATTTNTSGSAEQAYKNLTAAAGATLYSYNASSGALVAAGTAKTAQATDPLNTTGFTANVSKYANLYTESATSISARFDMQLVTSNLTTGAGGLQLVANTQTAFGNSYYNGTTLTTDTANNGSINSATNTALSDLGNASAVLADLTQVSDHLPIVADYSFVSTPEPTSLVLLGVAATGLSLGRRRSMQRAISDRG